MMILGCRRCWRRSCFEIWICLTHVRVIETENASSGPIFLILPGTSRFSSSCSGRQVSRIAGLILRFGYTFMICLYSFSSYDLANQISVASSFWCCLPPNLVLPVQALFSSTSLNFLWRSVVATTRACPISPSTIGIFI
jgi:hypothetical protein